MSIEQNCVKDGPCAIGMQIARDSNFDVFDIQRACIDGSADCQRYELVFSDNLSSERIAAFTCGVEAKLAFNAGIDSEHGDYDA